MSEGTYGTEWSDPEKVGEYSRVVFDRLAENVGVNNARFSAAWETCGMLLAVAVCEGEKDLAIEMAERMFDCRCRHVKPELSAK